MDPRSTYVIDTFRHLYQIPSEVNISYGPSPQEPLEGVHVINRAGSFFDARNSLDHKQLVFKEWHGTRLPFLFEDSARHDIFDRQESGIIINYDLLAAAFYFLSGWQEYSSHRKDTHGRFPFDQSLQYKLSSAQTPFVNYYFDILKTAIEQHYNIKLATRRVEDHPYTLVLTHDIDSLYSGWLQDGYHALKSGNIGEATGIVSQKLRGRDPWFNLDEILRFEKEHGVNSTFFFLPVEGEKNDIPHADYSIEDTEVVAQMDRILEAGSEVGLHGDYEAHQSAGALAHSIQKINRPLQGNRFHFLMFDMYQTPQALSHSGLNYDSTLGFSEHVGFRNGYCHPFYLYNLEKNRPTDILEIPLVVMDATLHLDKYMGLHPADTTSALQPVLRELQKFSGTASILWHNSYFSDLKFSGWKQVLSQLITSTQNRGGLVTKAEAIIETYNHMDRS